MAPQPPSSRLRLSSSLYTHSCHSDTTLSTTPSLRALYAATFYEQDDRPGSSPEGSTVAPPYAALNHRRDSSFVPFNGVLSAEDDFDALPLAVQRKYFSTLERLRLAQHPGPSLIQEPGGKSSHRRASLADRRGLTILPLIDSRRIDPFSRRQRKKPRNNSITQADAAWFLTLPDKVRKNQFSREEQIALGGFRESVLLDAADEAIYKARRRASRTSSRTSSRNFRSSMKGPDNTPRFSPPRIPSPIPSMHTADNKRLSLSSNFKKSMYDSFRWIDEEEDLDLRLVPLDDYHANLDGAVLPRADSSTRPSYRRTMSISKLPFGRRSSVTNFEPSPSSSNAAPSPRPSTHMRHKSRASVMSPKHNVTKSVSAIDPKTTHYQDPEARLKLRVYLASPQKFDEAIEFGFPAQDDMTSAFDKENIFPRKISRDEETQRLRAADTKSTTFFADDNSFFDDDASMLDPDSPVTPYDTDMLDRTQIRSHTPFSIREAKTSEDVPRSGYPKAFPHKSSEPYSQGLTGNREMTLRMTLTRPDLRADEPAMYGWQNSSTPEESSPASAMRASDEKGFLRGPLGGADGWEPEEKDAGVVKRLWKKMKPSHLKGN